MPRLRKKKEDLPPVSPEPEQRNDLFREYTQQRLVEADPEAYDRKVIKAIEEVRRQRDEKAKAQKEAEDATTLEKAPKTPKSPAPNHRSERQTTPAPAERTNSSPLRAEMPTGRSVFHQQPPRPHSQYQKATTDPEQKGDREIHQRIVSGQLSLYDCTQEELAASQRAMRPFPSVPMPPGREHEGPEGEWLTADWREKYC